MEGGYGPIIYVENLFGIEGFNITQTIVNMWVIMLLIVIVSFFATRKLAIRPSKRQVVVEGIYTTITGLNESSMGQENSRYIPYMGSLFLFLAISNIAGIVGVRPPTADFQVTFALGMLTFVLVQFNGIKFNGIGGYLKGFLSPSPVLLPINIVGELANPVSLSFRLFGNIIGGLIIMGLVYQGLSYVSTGVIGLGIPILAVAIPIPLHFYFDLFAGLLQSLIFTMLTMVFIKLAQD